MGALNVGTIGVFLVGVVLLVNGLVMLNVVPRRSAAPLNLFVGAIQIVFPTIILIQSGGDSTVAAATWPTYLFGITYLYYGLNIIFDLEPEGFGWFLRLRCHCRGLPGHHHGRC